LPQPPTGAFGPFDVDKKAPVISAITISPSSPTFGQTVTATYTCSDGGSGVVLCGPSGSQQIAATASTTVTSPADSTTGDHTFTVTSQDAVGNITMPASSVSYTVSKATPVITWANPAAIVYTRPRREPYSAWEYRRYPLPSLRATPRTTQAPPSRCR
jgi:hypothetical protein